MRTQLPPSRADGQGQPLKLLLWLALIFGSLGYLQAGEIVEDFLRATRNMFHPTSASGQIVFIAIDDRSIKEVGPWPWPRERLAVGSSRVDLQACKLEYSIVSPK